MSVSIWNMYSYSQQTEEVEQASWPCYWRDIEGRSCSTKLEVTRAWITQVLIQLVIQYVNTISVESGFAVAEAPFAFRSSELTVLMNMIM